MSPKASSGKHESPAPSEGPACKKVKSDQTAFSLNTAVLFNQPAYSDVTIKLDTKSIHCHKMIICNNSTYFNELCGPDAKFKEKDQTTIELKDDDPAAMEVLLHWLYCKDYSYVVLPIASGTTTSNMRLHLNVSLAADKYLLPELEAAAVNAVRQEVEDSDFLVADAAQMLEAVHEMDVTKEVATMAERLREKLLPKLLKEPVFRALLDRNSELRWKVIDGLAAFEAALPDHVFLGCKDCGFEYDWCKFENIPEMCKYCR